MKYVVTLVVGAVIGAIVGALWIGPGPEQVSGLTEEDVAAIRSTVESVVQATLADDWATWESCWAEDAVTVYPHGPPTEGRAAIRESWERVNARSLLQGGGYARAGQRERQDAPDPGETA